MYPTEFTPYASLIGGVLIGLSAVLFMLFNGRIAGISGLVKGVLFESDKAWRLLFLLGLVVGGFAFYQSNEFYFDYRKAYPIGLTIVGGILVGIGTAMGSGCTSGHGVCGMSRFSLRSIVATLVYLFVGIISAVVTVKYFL